MRMILFVLATAYAALVPMACLAIDSGVPAIAEPADAIARDLAPGRYCVAMADIDPAGAVRDVALGGCVTAWLEGARLTLAAEDAPFVRTVFVVAELGRGVSLLQTRDADGTYRFHAAILREGGLAILPPPGLDLAMRTRADAVALEPTPDAAPRPGDAGPAAPFAIRAGAPGDVLAFLRELSGRRFDMALRDRDLGRTLFDDTRYLVHVGADADADADGGADDRAAAAVDRLRQAIGRAMALE